MTMTGRFIGAKAGTIRLEHRSGQAAHAEVLHFSDESVTFQVPNGLSGLWDLVVSNGIDTTVERDWCTFDALPLGAIGEATEVDLVGVYRDTLDTPTAIQFDGCLWVFGMKDTLDLFSDCYDCSSGTWNNTPDPPGKSYTQQTPLIVDGVLWVFHVTREGFVEYSKYNSAAKEWSEKTLVPNVLTNRDWAVGVAYNNVVTPGRIELFYNWDLNRNCGGGISRTYTDNHGQSWSTPETVIYGATEGPDALFWESAVYWDSTQNATISVPNATLLSYKIRDGIAVSYLQDGKLIYTGNYSVVTPGWLPKLADLGEDFIAVLSSDGNLQPAIRKMSKATGMWESIWKPIPYFGGYANFNPTGAVGMTKVVDPLSEGGYRYDTYFYLFYGHTVSGLTYEHNEWKMTIVEYPGYYTEPNPPVPVDFSSELQDTFYLWPVIGIMDAPPFVLNGHSIDEYDCIPAPECTRAEFGAGSGTEVEVGLGASIGPYFETGQMSPVKIQISAEINVDVNKDVTKTEKQVDILFRSLEGSIMVFYVVPEVQTHTYQWYDHTEEEAGKAVYVVELLKLTLQNMIFDPRESPCPGCLNMPDSYWSSFPTHAADADLDRLSTYNTVPTEPALFDSTATWNSGGQAVIEWAADQSTSLETGVGIEFKIGMGGLIGGGVQGSFELHLTTTTSFMTNANTYLVNFDAEKAGDIRRFVANGFWLQPNESGYWLPVNRQGLGDKPWFITYYVSGIQQY